MIENVGKKKFHVTAIPLVPKVLQSVLRKVENIIHLYTTVRALELVLWMSNNSICSLWCALKYNDDQTCNWLILEPVKTLITVCLENIGLIFVTTMRVYFARNRVYKQEVWCKCPWSTLWPNPWHDKLLFYKVGEGAVNCYTEFVARGTQYCCEIL